MIRKHIGIILAIVIITIFAYHFNIWCSCQVIEGVENQQKSYNAGNENIGTKVQTNAGNIQYLQDKVKKMDGLDQHVAKIQTNVDKLNNQMASIKAAQTGRAKDSQKATSKPVTGLH